MLEIRYVHNHTYKVLKANSHEIIGVYTRQNDIEFVKWLGFIELGSAKHLQHQGLAKPVRLEVSAYAKVEPNYSMKWVDINGGDYLQGCYLLHCRAAFAVVDDWRPRLVRRASLLDAPVSRSRRPQHY